MNPIVLQIHVLKGFLTTHLGMYSFIRHDTWRLALCNAIERAQLRQWIKHHREKDESYQKLGVVCCIVVVVCTTLHNK